MEWCAHVLTDYIMTGSVSPMLAIQLIISLIGRKASPKNVGLVSLSDGVNLSLYDVTLILQYQFQWNSFRQNIHSRDIQTMGLRC